MPLAERSRAIEPVQGIAHREQPLRALAGQHQVSERLRPGVRALEVLRELGVAFGELEGKAIGGVAEVLDEAIGNQRVVRIFGGQAYENERFAAS